MPKWKSSQRRPFDVSDDTYNHCRLFRRRAAGAGVSGPVVVAVSEVCLEKAVNNPQKCSRGVFTKAAILKGPGERKPWGFVAAAYAKTGTPGELGELLWEVKSEDRGPIHHRTERRALSGAQHVLDPILKAAGIGAMRRMNFIFQARVWRY